MGPLSDDCLCHRCQANEEEKLRRLAEYEVSLDAGDEVNEGSLARHVQTRPSRAYRATLERELPLCDECSSAAARVIQQRNKALAGSLDHRHSSRTDAGSAVAVVQPTPLGGRVARAIALGIWLAVFCLHAFETMCSASEADVSPNVAAEHAGWCSSAAAEYLHSAFASVAFLSSFDEERPELILRWAALVSGAMATWVSHRGFFSFALCAAGVGLLASTQQDPGPAWVLAVWPLTAGWARLAARRAARAASATADVRASAATAAEAPTAANPKLSEPRRTAGVLLGADGKMRLPSLWKPQAAVPTASLSDAASLRPRTTQKLLPADSQPPPAARVVRCDEHLSRSPPTVPASPSRTIARSFARLVLDDAAEPARADLPQEMSPSRNAPTKTPPMRPPAAVTVNADRDGPTPRLVLAEAEDGRRTIIFCEPLRLSYTLLCCYPADSHVFASCLGQHGRTVRNVAPGRGRRHGEPVRPRNEKALASSWSRERMPPLAAHRAKEPALRRRATLLALVREPGRRAGSSRTGWQPACERNGGRCRFHRGEPGSVGRRAQVAGGGLYLQRRAQYPPRCSAFRPGPKRCGVARAATVGVVRCWCAPRGVDGAVNVTTRTCLRSTGAGRLGTCHRIWSRAKAIGTNPLLPAAQPRS